jgi:hypothetical protein
MRDFYSVVRRQRETEQIELARRGALGLTAGQPVQFPAHSAERGGSQSVTRRTGPAQLLLRWGHMVGANRPRARQS